jgi:hypothetical protein
MTIELGRQSSRQGKFRARVLLLEGKEKVLLKIL